MVKDHLSNNDYRDYAFVEYYTIEEATNALEQMKKTPMIIRGEVIYAAFSKIKREDNGIMNTQQQVIYCYYVFFFVQVVKNFNINTSNLTNEEKEKFKNITMLQNLCDKSRGNEVPQPVVNQVNNDPVVKEGQMNIRREPTKREKIEMEMKKWSKQVILIEIEKI